jgi:serine/threonine protein kinase/putative hemolysin
MGEVYRARDAKLGRDVALKILPPLFAQDPERLTRFQREAHLLASLSHPNIATIFGFEEAGPALVLELVEGPTLADRIAEGPLSVPEALAIARQIGDALDAAHAQGIVHRDLKPANVKLRPDGTVKVLDFGLAKALSAETAPGTGDEMNSPTLTARFTQLGVILGTAAYMSPEQARGKPVDKRADIWAFGCVLFEMVTGKRPFAGDDLTETLASVVKEAPGVDQAPAEVRRLLRKCLEKDPRRRLRDIGDAWDLMDEPAAATTGVGIATAAPPKRSRWPWFVAATALALAAAIAAIHFREASPEVAVTRFQLQWPASGDASASGTVRFFQVSPNGRYVAMVAQNALWVRPLDSVEATRLERTQGVTYPFWSPDSQSIGFFQGGQLKVIGREGGAVRTLCAAPDGRGGAWSPNGTILFGDQFGNHGLARVAEQGGTVERVTKVATPGRSDAHRYPHFLPDGNRFVYLYLSSDAALSGVYVAALDGAAPVRLIDGADSAQFVPASASSRDGFLLFRRQDALMAQRLDVGRTSLTGTAVAVATGVGTGENTGLGAFSAGAEGTLIYTGDAGFQQDVVWIDRTGKRERVVGSNLTVNDLSLSPSGRVVAMSLQRSAVESDVFLQGDTGTASRFTFGPPPGWNFPVWSPKGDQIAFSSLDLAGRPRYEIRRKASNGAGVEETLLSATETVWLWDWSPDGKYLVFANSSDLKLLPLEGDRTPVPFTRTPIEDQYGQVSPDGRWMLYASGDRGDANVFVQPIPPTGALWQVSQGGGTAPRWRRDGKELYYRRPDGQLMAVAVTTGTGSVFQFSGTPQAMFPIPSTGNVERYIYQPSADGQRFLVSQPVAGSDPPITVVLNWLAALKQ